LCMLATGIARARAPPSARMSSLTRPGFQPAPLHTLGKESFLAMAGALVDSAEMTEDDGL